MDPSRTVILGLSERDHTLIVQTLARVPKLSRAVVFGSRAKGTFRPNSDIDLAVWGLTTLEAEALRLELEELPLPYSFNVLAFEAIDSLPLREHIERVGKRLLPP